MQLGSGIKPAVGYRRNLLLEKPLRRQQSCFHDEPAQAIRESVLLKYQPLVHANNIIAPAAPTTIAAAATVIRFGLQKEFYGGHLR